MLSKWTARSVCSCGRRKPSLSAGDAVPIILHDLVRGNLLSAFEAIYTSVRERKMSQNSEITTAEHNGKDTHKELIQAIRHT